MIGTIVFKELLLATRTLRFTIVLLICAILIPASVLVLSNDYLSEKTDYDNRVSLEKNRETGKTGAVNVFRPIPPLMALFRGVSTQAVNGVRLDDGPWNTPIASATQSPTAAVYPTVDLAFIVGIVLSALAIILSFDSFSGEKEDATLRLILSNSVSRAGLVVGKWIGLTLALLVPFLLGVVISAVIFTSVTGISLLGEVGLILSLNLSAAALYLSLFILLGILVSVLTRSPAQSIFIGLGVWGLLAILLPQISVAAAGALEPLPPPKSVEKEMRIKTANLLKEIKKANTAMTERAKSEDWDSSEVYLKRRENEYPRHSRHRHEVISLEMDYWLKVEGQERLGRMLALVSPSGCLNQALISLADTGPEGQRDFMIQAYEYGRWYFDELRKNPSDPPTAEKALGMEPFVYRPLALTARLEYALLPLMMLAIMSVVLLAVAVFTFNKYDPR